MPAPFKCSECGFETKVKDELAGKKIKCPKCKAAGLVGGKGKGTPAARKKPKAQAADSEDGLLAVNLESFQDVETEEGEILDESQRVKQPKKKKKKKTVSLDPQVKAAATGFSLISALVLAALVYYVGLPALEEWNKEKPPEKPASGENAEAGAAGAPGAAENAAENPAG